MREEAVSLLRSKGLAVELPAVKTLKMLEVDLIGGDRRTQASEVCCVLFSREY